MRVIDLSRQLESGMPVYPGDSEVTIEIVQQRSESGWEVRDLRMGSHTGTHVDACSHAHDDGATLDDIPIDRFMGQAVCIRDRTPLPTTIGLIFDCHISEEHTDEILAARPPFVAGPSLDEALERRLLSDGILTYDGLVNTDQLPDDTPFTFVGLPLKIVSGDGSPVRAIAILD
jgi:arylformamidase